jgi:hypothetical protein
MEEEEAILIGSVRFSFFVNYATPAPRAVPLSSSSSRSSSSSYLKSPANDEEPDVLLHSTEEQVHRRGFAPHAHRRE